MPAQAPLFRKAHLLDPPYAAGTPALAEPPSSSPNVGRPGLQLARGALHELYAARHGEAASLSGFALMLGRSQDSRMQLWVRHGMHDRESGAPYPAGLAELGIDPSRMLLVRARDAQSALQAGLEGARCASLGAAIIELWGETSIYNLTASRRLALAARASGSCVLIVRSAAAPHPSAAETRWLARAAPSRALEANAPGHPAFYLSLLRGRHGQEGLNHHLEWNRDAQRLEPRPGDAGQAFRDIQPAAGRPAPLPGVVVSVSFDRSNPPRDGMAARQRTG